MGPGACGNPMGCEENTCYTTEPGCLEPAAINFDEKAVVMNHECFVKFADLDSVVSGHDYHTQDLSGAGVNFGDYVLADGSISLTTSTQGDNVKIFLAAMISANS